MKFGTEAGSPRAIGRVIANRVVEPTAIRLLEGSRSSPIRSEYVAGHIVNWSQITVCRFSCRNVRLPKFTIRAGQLLKAKLAWLDSETWTIRTRLLWARDHLNGAVSSSSACNDWPHALKELAHDLTMSNNRRCRA